MDQGDVAAHPGERCPRAHVRRTEFYGEAVAYWNYNYFQTLDWGTPE
jgi:hypothetical protein